MEPKTFNTLEIDQDSWFDEGDTKMIDKKNVTENEKNEELQKTDNSGRRIARKL